MPSSVGSQATSSFEPIVGSTPKPGRATHVRVTQPEIAERSAEVPAVKGYPGASAAPDNAAWISGGTGSTGGPLDRATSPPRWGPARAFPGSGRAHGEAGETAGRGKARA